MEIIDGLDLSQLFARHLAFGEWAELEFGAGLLSSYTWWVSCLA